MLKNTISRLESLIKSSDKDLYYSYLKVLNIYKFFITNIQEFSEEDHLEIITFFYEKLLTENKDIFSFASGEKNVFFNGNRVKEKNFRLGLEYYRNRIVSGMSHGESILHIEKNNRLYSGSTIRFLKENSQILEEVYNFNEHIYQDKLEEVASEDSFYNLYSDNYCDIIIIRKNFFSDINPSLFSRSGLILRFCESGQIAFKKNNIMLNGKEVLVSKGIYLGNYKVLTSNISYVTFHIKENFFKELGIDIPDYILEKHYWKITDKALGILDELKNLKNAKIILLNFISEVILKFTGDEKRIAFNEISGSELLNVLEYIDLNLENSLSVSLIQKKFGLNKNSILEIFKKNFGISVSKYILNRKLEKASHYLLETDFSVTEITSKLNFVNVGKFSHYFKEKYSLTPLKFKKKFQKMSKT